MRNLNINKGYRTYSINGDENVTITVKTTDFAIIDRLLKVKENIGKVVEELKNLNDNAAPEEYIAALAAAEKKTRAELDAVFDSPVSAAVFGNMNCLSLAGGQPVALNFVDAIIPVISADLEAEHKAAEQRIAQYTEAARQFS